MEDRLENDSGVCGAGEQELLHAVLTDAEHLDVGGGDVGDLVEPVLQDGGRHRAGGKGGDADGPALALPEVGEGGRGALGGLEGFGEGAAADEAAAVDTVGGDHLEQQATAACDHGRADANIGDVVAAGDEGLNHGRA